MNRNETAFAVIPELRFQNFMMAIGMPLMTASAFMALFFGAGTVSLLWAEPNSRMSLDVYIPLGIYMLAVGAISTGFLMPTLASERRVTALWHALYGGTRWYIPSGEIATVKSCGDKGATVVLSFDVGLDRTFAVQHLVPVEPGPHSDMAGLGQDMVPSVEGPAMSTGWLLSISGAVWTVLVCLTLALSSAGADGWAMIPMLVIDVLGALFPIVYSTDTVFKASKVSDHAVAMSKTRWKSIDGRVGDVRWAEKTYFGEGKYSEEIVLRYDDGDVESYRREDVRPMTFEPAVPEFVCKADAFNPEMV